jgi:hypothetical protein
LLRATGQIAADTGVGEFHFPIVVAADNCEIRIADTNLARLFAACNISPRVFLVAMPVTDSLPLDDDDPDDEDYERDEEDDDIADHDDEGDDFAGWV